MTTSRTFLAALPLLCASLAPAATVTLDFNGFPNLTGGQITNPELKEPIKIKPGEQQAKLEGLQPGKTYTVDLFHNFGEHGSDFAFTVNDAGTGVASVGKGGADQFDMVTGFKPGDTTLKLATYEIVVNENGAQTGTYHVPGLIPAQPQSGGPKRVKAVPGIYNVDNLYNTAAGLEDYAFIVDNRGDLRGAPEVKSVAATATQPAVHSRPGGDEFAEFQGSSLRPRAATVRFKLESSAAGVNYHGSHVIPGQPTVNGNVTEFDMPIAVGGGGLNVWTFGKNKVEGGDALTPDGKPLKGTARDNDFYFYPRLRWAAGKGFYFETERGAATGVTATATGAADDKSPLTVKVTATIVGPYPVGKATTQAATTQAAK